MYRREGTVYVRMWCVVRGRVPTPSSWFYLQKLIHDAWNHEN